MAFERTADDARDEYVRSMGPELGGLFHALWQEMAWIHVKWHEYCELFGTRPSRVDLLNEAAPLFFRIVQDSLFQDILIHITRLTDPPESCGKENLTILRIPSLLRDEQARAKVNELIKIACEKREFCRDWRNRRIAHADYRLALNEETQPLEGASRQKVKEALEAISNVLNLVQHHCTRGKSRFEPGLDFGGAGDLIRVIDAGLRVEKERQERLQAGERRPEDFQHRDL